MLQCSFCSAACRKLQRNFRFRLWHVAGVGFRGVGFRTRPVARGQKLTCCVRSPRNINVFVRVPGREESGSRPGGSVTGVTKKLFMCQMFMCQMFMCLFRPLALGRSLHFGFLAVRSVSPKVWGWNRSSASGFRFWQFLWGRGVSVSQHGFPEGPEGKVRRGSHVPPASPPPHLTNPHHRPPSRRFEFGSFFGRLRVDFTQRAQRSKKFERFRARLKISSENEIFERATHRGPIFFGEIETSRSNISTSRSKISIEIKKVSIEIKTFFDRWALSTV